MLFLLSSLLQVEGLGPHPHSFVRDGDEKRTVAVTVDASAGKDKIVGTVSSGIRDLLVLKSGGSSFTGFHRDENTTLPEVEDRIFSTSVTLSYDIALPANIPITIDSIPEIDAAVGFSKVRTADNSFLVWVLVLTSVIRLLTRLVPHPLDGCHWTQGDA